MKPWQLEHPATPWMDKEFSVMFICIPFPHKSPASTQRNKTGFYPAESPYFISIELL